MQASESTSLPENAYVPLKPGEHYTPMVPAESKQAELTWRSVSWGIFVCVLFSVASAYSGLKVGQGMEAAIPISILAIGLARVFKRKVFGAKLADYQLTQAKIAEMAVAIDASALLIYRSAWTKDVKGGRVTREASMAKQFATDQAQVVIDEAVQLWGGLGVVSGVTVEKLYREIRALRIYEGTRICCGAKARRP